LTWILDERAANCHGQANIKAYNRQLSTLISVGKAKPSLIVSHELSLNEALMPKHYDAREKDGRK
jgi:hypothetical protein